MYVWSSTHASKQFGKLIGTSVNSLQKWDRKGIVPALRSPTNRRYSTHTHYVQYRGLMSSEQRRVIEQIELGHVKRQVIGCQDHLVRFGYEWFEAFCQRHGTEILVLNGESLSPEEELVRDVLAIVTVFSARLHGLRSQKNVI